MSTSTHINGHILAVLCTSKSLTSSVCHYVKDGVSNHLAVCFTTFPVRNSCRVKCSKVTKLGKINVNLYLILQILRLSRFLTKQVVYDHTNVFIYLGTYLSNMHLNAKLHMPIKSSSTQIYLEFDSRNFDSSTTEIAM